MLPTGFIGAEIYDEREYEFDDEVSDMAKGYAEEKADISLTNKR